MKKLNILASLCALALLSAAPAGGQVPALVSFDAALAGAPKRPVDDGAEG